MVCGNCPSKRSCGSSKVQRIKVMELVGGRCVPSGHASPEFDVLLPLGAIQELTKNASGTVTLGAYKGNLFFLKLTGVAASLYNEADSSMEASDGLNPVSSQGYAEVQSVEARSLAYAGQITEYPTGREPEGGAKAKRARTK